MHLRCSLPIVSRTKHPDLAEFWNCEFPTIPQTSVQPILTRLSALLAPLSPLARIFSNPENELDFSAMLQQGKIFIVNLAKGEMGDEPSKLLGGMFTAAFQQAALARAGIPEAKRRPFYLYVDEFQNFTIKSTFDSILSESRKYRLYLTLAHQDISQIPQNIRSAIFGNVATLISFPISANDAPILRKEMHRTRLTVRRPETATYIPVGEFVAYQKEQYRNALADKNSGMSREELQAVREISFMDSVRYHNSRTAQIKRGLATLESPGLNAQVLHELFPDYQFRELEFPDVDDFLNLPAYHAFCRIEHADNVFCFKALPPPHSSAETRRAVHERIRARAARRPPVPTVSAAVAPPRNAPPLPPPTPAATVARANGRPAALPARVKAPQPPLRQEQAPKKEEDFSF
jgi:hypothetical protein